jgi:hypothetical protein
MKLAIASIIFSFLSCLLHAQNPVVTSKPVTKTNFQSLIVKNIKTKEFVGLNDNYGVYTFRINIEGGIDSIAVADSLEVRIDHEIVELIKEVRYSPGTLNDSESPFLMSFSVFYKEGGIYVTSGRIAPFENDPAKYTGDIVREEMPSYPGGENAMIMYLAKNIHMPESFQGEGTVYTMFNINECGIVESVFIAKGVNVECDQAAVTVVHGMPAFNPGRVNGVPIKTKFSIPIRFIK